MRLKEMQRAPGCRTHILIDVSIGLTTCSWSRAWLASQKPISFGTRPATARNGIGNILTVTNMVTKLRLSCGEEAGR